MPDKLFNSQATLVASTKTRIGINGDVIGNLKGFLILKDLRLDKRRYTTYFNLRKDSARNAHQHLGTTGDVLIGIGVGEVFIASNLPAFLEHTRQMVFLESQQMAVVRQYSLHMQTLDGSTVIPLQLQAYHIAALRGLSVNQPRNLAKSVTVE